MDDTEFRQLAPGRRVWGLPSVSIYDRSEKPPEPRSRKRAWFRAGMAFTAALAILWVAGYHEQVILTVMMLTIFGIILIVQNLEGEN